MTRDEAVTRINEGIGFRAAGHSLEAVIVRRLQEAQRDLEKGKTLPRFLLVENQPLTLLAGEHTVAIPADFLRIYDDDPIHFTPEGSDLPRFLQAKRSYRDAVLANVREVDEAVAPSIYVLRGAVIDFITVADTDYDMLWSYYAKDDILTTNIENLWLANAADWLIGFAGRRLATDLRDQSAVAAFTAMQQEGRAAVFGDDVASEESGGPIEMGVNL